VNGGSGIFRVFKVAKVSLPLDTWNRRLIYMFVNVVANFMILLFICSIYAPHKHIERNTCGTLYTPQLHTCSTGCHTLQSLTLVAHVSSIFSCLFNPLRNLASSSFSIKCCCSIHTYSFFVLKGQMYIYIYIYVCVFHR
jgi:hypothetical protein